MVHAVLGKKFVADPRGACPASAGHFIPVIDGNAVLLAIVEDYVAQRCNVGVDRVGTRCAVDGATLAVLAFTLTFRVVATLR